jgi:hypothetical protein
MYILLVQRFLSTGLKDPKLTIYSFPAKQVFLFSYLQRQSDNVSLDNGDIAEHKGVVTNSQG